LVSRYGALILPNWESHARGRWSLRVVQTKGRTEDVGVGSMAETRMELSDLLGSVWKTRGVFSEQIFGLMLEMIEVWIGGEASYRHNELPFVCPGSACNGQKVSSSRRVG